MEIAYGEYCKRQQEGAHFIARVLSKIDVKPRWKSRNQVGEDSEFIRALIKEEKVARVQVGGYIIMHMPGYLDF